MVQLRVFGIASSFQGHNLPLRCLYHVHSTRLKIYYLGIRLQDIINDLKGLKDESMKSSEDTQTASLLKIRLVRAC